MTRHPREEIFDRARLEIDVFLVELIKKHALTYGEIFALLAHALTSWSKWLVKDERQKSWDGEFYRR